MSPWVNRPLKFYHKKIAFLIQYSTADKGFHSIPQNVTGSKLVTARVIKPSTELSWHSCRHLTKVSSLIAPAIHYPQPLSDSLALSSVFINNAVNPPSPPIEPSAFLGQITELSNYSMIVQFWSAF